MNGEEARQVAKAIIEQTNISDLIKNVGRLEGRFEGVEKSLTEYKKDNNRAHEEIFNRLNSHHCMKGKTIDGYGTRLMNAESEISTIKIGNAERKGFFKGVDKTTILIVSLLSLIIGALGLFIGMKIF